MGGVGRGCQAHAYDICYILYFNKSLVVKHNRRLGLFSLRRLFTCSLTVESSSLCSISRYRMSFHSLSGPRNAMSSRRSTLSNSGCCQCMTGTHVHEDTKRNILECCSYLRSYNIPPQSGPIRTLDTWTRSPGSSLVRIHVHC